MADNSTGHDISARLCEQVAQAFADQSPLSIQAGNSKAFYGRKSKGAVLSLAGHTGIIAYEPSELVITARAGTRLGEIEQALQQQRQMLAFEAPRFTDQTTIGGVVASGLSGPRRPFSGAVRDFVLGVRIINGKGENLRFGGQVMKNVAGYDVSRLIAGSLGTLGVIQEVSLKVLPAPQVEYTLKQVCPQREALRRFAEWNARALPVSAACWFDQNLYLRLSGTEAGVRHAQHLLGNNVLEATGDWWASIRDLQHPFFVAEQPLWRLSLPPATPPLALSGNWLIDWAGGQRWLYSHEDAEHIRSVAARAGGHATAFRNGDREADVFHPLPAPLFALHQRIKAALDPQRIFNPGRLYQDL